MCPDCLLVRQDLHEICVMFCSWYVVFLQYLLSTFSEKEHSAAIYFPPLFQCKTNTSALELLTEMIRPSLENFFLNPMQFRMFRRAWKR